MVIALINTKLPILFIFRNETLSNAEEEDTNYRLNYQKALLTFNLFLRAINDMLLKKGTGKGFLNFIGLPFCISDVMGDTSMHLPF